jgi:hypothetical protein
MWPTIISFGRIGEKSPIANSWATFHYYYKSAKQKANIEPIKPKS